MSLPVQLICKILSFVLKGKYVNSPEKFVRKSTFENVTIINPDPLYKATFRSSKYGPRVCRSGPLGDVKGCKSGRRLHEVWVRIRRDEGCVRV